MEEIVSETIKVACGQFEPVFGDVNANLSKIQEMVEAADADLVVFPELCTSGYELKDRNEAQSLALEPATDPEFEWLRELAAANGSHIILGFPERSGSKVFNSCALIEPSGTINTYAKLHLFDREKNLFDPGEVSPRVISTEIGRIGMMICFDWIFPETARLLALAGAQIICHPSNLVLTYCQRSMFARSVENGVFTMTCNRIGTETRTDRTLSFTGGSQILSNRGVTLAQARTDSEEIISAEIRPGDADDKMITGRNDLLGDRRMDHYSGLIS
jgi:predicted amidohydrolase